VTGNLAEAAATEATPEPTPEEEPVVEYNYDPIGKRDPFRSLVVAELQPSATPLTELQRYDLDQLKVVGIIYGIASPRAMIQTPDGKGHVAKKGTPIGKGRGRVTRITQREVVVAEEYRDLDGRLLVNETALMIKEDS
jgi:type IV pilus assembly protein PilP